MSVYVVSGGAGFLGSHLIDALMKDGHEVICIDNLITGSKDNLGQHEGNPHFQFINADISDAPVEIDRKVDFVLNLACPASPLDYRKHARETLRVCSSGVLNMLELAKKHKARFFHTSTSEVYGDPEKHPQPESYWGNVNPYGERSCYDEGKRYAEALTYIYRKDFGVDTAIVRIFNTYGPRMKPRDGRVVSTYIRQALKGEDITVFGTGKQTRSFCYVDDQIDGQLKLIHSKEEGPINIGNANEFTMLELANEILQITSSKSKIVFQPLPSDDPTQRQPDISLAKDKLGWEPKTPLREGLLKTIEWYKGNYEI